MRNIISAVLLCGALIMLIWALSSFQEAKLDFSTSVPPSEKAMTLLIASGTLFLLTLFLRFRPRKTV